MGPLLQYECQIAPLLDARGQTPPAGNRRLLHHNRLSSGSDTQWKFSGLFFHTLHYSGPSGLIHGNSDHDFADIDTSQAYSVTKAAQIHLVKALAKIVGPSVRVNSVSPGILMTVSPSVPRIIKNVPENVQDWGRQFSEEKLKAAMDKSALNRLAAIEV